MSGSATVAPPLSSSLVTSMSSHLLMLLREACIVVFSSPSRLLSAAMFTRCVSICVISDEADGWSCLFSLKKQLQMLLVIPLMQINTITVALKTPTQLVCLHLKSTPYTVCQQLKSSVSLHFVLVPFDDHHTSHCQITYCCERFILWEVYCPFKNHTIRSFNW